ncbi:uncharacterized protein LOC130448547, partial [Diorhabda sublineata]|uniref:uncharacterized protein LOC130448547 n=1 Tax=Diorhabda sublineata TaxID=1163346 RepID=UPI0024E0FAA2
METYEDVIFMKQQVHQRSTANLRVHNFDNRSMNIDNYIDEPIDLTINHTDALQKSRKKCEMVNLRLPINNDVGKDYKNFPSSLSVTDDEAQGHQTFTQTKQLEILKAAKSLFSKRTRTLYHWLYPNSSKQQIKTTVSTSWDSLAENEKAFYISQVLGRFGFSQSSLMVNPQLCSLKEIPPSIKKSDTRPKTRELQNAICSITSDSSSAPNRKKRGRPKMDRKVRNVEQEFQDDPELSCELEKFSIQFNM